MLHYSFPPSNYGLRKCLSPGSTSPAVMIISYSALHLLYKPTTLTSLFYQIDNTCIYHGNMSLHHIVYYNTVLPCISTITHLLNKTVRVKESVLNT